MSAGKNRSASSQDQPQHQPPDQPQDHSRDAPSNHSLAEPLPVAVCIVTYDSAADLPGCLESLRQLEPPVSEVVIIDCASRDGCGAVARKLAAEESVLPLEAIALGENLGFAGGMNRAIAETSAPFVLSLNADARPRPDFIAKLLGRIEAAAEYPVAAVTGRLLRPAEAARGAKLAGVRRLDACGMRLRPTWRHLDRGSGEVDHGQLMQAERVFGGTGAATLFRRSALADAAVDGDIFDPAFHSFREDAELCFRLRERGFEILYEPLAVAEHRRWNLPERRSAMPPAVNYHSLKNRYLLRFYHQTARNFLLTLPPTLARDLLALGYVVLRERSSLAAYRWLWQNRRAIQRRRRLIQQRRTVRAALIDRWFFTSGMPL